MGAATSVAGCFRGLLHAVLPRHVAGASATGSNVADVEGLRRQLAAARGAVSRLEGELDLAMSRRLQELQKSERGDDKKVTVFLDGAFDLMHFGHANAFRQARLLGDRLIVGVNSDVSISECKGPPIMNDSERQAAVAACRYVDEVIPASPYVMTEEYIRRLIEEDGVDLFVHGEDPCIVDGRDVYAVAKGLGRFRTIPRTENVSTTDIVGRVLLLTREHHVAPSSGDGTEEPRPVPMSASTASFFPLCVNAKSLVTSSLYGLFLSGLPTPNKGSPKVVYIDGAWDMFHAGHISTLHRARELGDWLIVGVHSDAVVNKRRGGNYPIMNMQERTMALLGCRHVDDILLDAPLKVTREMIASLQLSVVVRRSRRAAPQLPADEDDELYEVPKALGILQTLESEVDLTVEDIIARIHEHQGRLSQRHLVKSGKETAWYREKHGL